MNLVHRWICSSARWRRAVETTIIPWALEELNLGRNVLEVGPGYGATTDLLRNRCDHLTCVEIDAELAKRLRRRVLGSNVTVLCEDGTAMSLPDARFDGAVCFTMLHHVSSADLQNKLLAEVARVLRPGGIFAGTDSVSSRLFRALHLFDTLVVVEPDSFPDRLKAAGFDEVQIEVTPRRFRFRARKACLPVNGTGQVRFG